MTISDFLHLPNFSDLRLLAGENGISNELTNVTVVDTPDGTNWLSGDEFVLTTAYMLHEESDLLLFLRTLSQKKAAGLGIKENRYIADIPSSALALSNELKLPLISVPESYPICGYHQPGTDPDHKRAVVSFVSVQHDPQRISWTCHQQRQRAGNSENIE